MLPYASQIGLIGLLGVVERARSHAAVERSHLKIIAKGYLRRYAKKSYKARHAFQTAVKHSRVLRVLCKAENPLDLRDEIEGGALWIDRPVHLPELDGPAELAGSS